MLGFWKVTSENLNNRETCRYLIHFKFSDVISNEVCLKFKLIQTKNIFFERIYHEKTEKGQKCPHHLNWFEPIRDIGYFTAEEESR